MATKTLISLIVFLASLRDVHSHAFLTKPTSKQGGNEQSYQLDRAKHFSMAAWWLDRAYFDNDRKQTPFTRPGEFSYKDANTCCGVKQVFHPCGCQHNDISSCAAVGKARGFGEIIGSDSIVPEKVALGGKLKTKFTMHVNHAGGYTYSICPKSEYDRCFTEHNPKSGATDAPSTVAYLKCVWDCFESHPLSFAGEQFLQLRGTESDRVTLNSVSKPGRSGKLKTFYREVPIAEVGDGKNSWQYVESFSNDKVKAQFTSDFGPQVPKGTAQVGPNGHTPSKWQVVDEVQIPTSASGLTPGKYLLSWRYDCGMADQLWTNCADVELVVDPKTTVTTTPAPKTTATTTPAAAKVTWKSVGSNTECDAGAGEVYRAQSSAQRSSLEQCKQSCQDEPACKSITYFANAWCSHFSTPCTKTKRSDNAVAMRLSSASTATTTAMTNDTPSIDDTDTGNDSDNRAGKGTSTPAWSVSDDTSRTISGTGAWIVASIATALMTCTWD